MASPLGALRKLGALSGLVLAACGGDDGPGFPHDVCAPLDATPGAEVELGIGESTFEPMPDVLPVVRDLSQSDPHIVVNARIRGLPPGNPDDILDRHNPRTKASAAIEDLGWTLGPECPGSLPYVASPEPGAYDLIQPYKLGFMGLPVDEAAGKQARITIEVIGTNGLSARAEKLVTLMVPPRGTSGAPGASVTSGEAP